ncbi:TonB-dependent receptor [Sphingobium algorifonticola]|uniref:TonB-dependent receptor n=1 Tax=Sphingobium algorifonticola TaxID=2008318 RepID=A0A437J7Q0_9SPHN|nr:TonB-dependent receptor [Sphingobium algorifonticola]RVT41211.1 TonB-dependent receptor [Sphingobium algorifonticola]
MRALWASTVLSAIVAPGTAQAAEDAAAQSEPQAAVSADDPQGGLTEIVVTATRTAQSIQTVPISMQALSADALQQRQVKGLTDFVALLPSVSFEGIGPGRNAVYFRGIVPAGGTYASVGYYLDDIPITEVNLPDIHAYDLERVESLAGPQGTLYGAGSLAGTIRLITQKPKLNTFEFGYDVEANKYGKGDFGGQIESYINVPLSDTMAVRAMGYFRRDGGYIDNTPNNGRLNTGAPAVYTLGDDNPLTFLNLDNSDIAKDDYNTIKEYGGRVQILWEPADGWQITPQLTAQRQIARGYFGFDPRVGDLEVHDYDQTRNDDRWYQATLSINGHIGDWDIVSATGFFKRKTATLNDYTYYTVTYDGFGGGYESYLQFFDASGCTGSGASLRCTTLLDPTQFYHADNQRNKFTQELRLTTPKDWPFDVTFGGFYQRQKNKNNVYYAIRGLDTAVGYTDTCAYSGPQSGCDGNTTTLAGFGIPTSQGGTMVVAAPAVKDDGYYIVENNQLYHDYALFAEGHYDITPTLKITGGIRYFWTDYAIVGFAGVPASARNTVTSLFVPTGTLGCPTPLPAERLQCLNTNFRAADQTGRYKEDGETHKIALNWQFKPDKMIYANYSTGFRPGGFNRPLRIRNFGEVDVAPFESETLTNYELGVKTVWDNVFRFNASIYLEKWNNIQYGVVVSGAQGAGITGNAGKAEVKGVEFESELKLGKFTFFTSGAYNDGKLTGDFCNFALDRTTSTISQLATCQVGVDVPNSNPPTPSVAAADGIRLPRQPKFKGTASVRYDTELGSLNAYVQGAALYQTSATQDLNVDNNNQLVCPDVAEERTLAGVSCTTKGFVSFDFSAGIKKDNWSLTVFLQNAFDKRGQLSTNTFCSIDFCANSSRIFTIKPQFFGIRFGRKY